MLFGSRFYTAYQPVFDTAGKVIGILYVGIPIWRSSTACCCRRSWPLVIATAVAALLALGMTMMMCSPRHQAAEGP